MDFPKPSTYTPFFRRFTDERAKELEETKALYAWVKAKQDAFTEDATTIGKRIYPSFIHLDGDIENAFIGLMLDMIESEQYLAEIPPPTFDTMNLEGFVGKLLDHFESLTAGMALVFVQRHTATSC